MKMVCAKADVCGIDCEDKNPHEKELACDVECDWHGRCIPCEKPSLCIICSTPIKLADDVLCFRCENEMLLGLLTQVKK